MTSERVAESCDHTDAYGSAVMEGGSYSAYPGKAMCIICDRPAPFLTLLDWVDNRPGVATPEVATPIRAGEGVDAPRLKNSATGANGLDR